MTTDQHPLPTPFTAASTATDVLRSVNLVGRNIIVTGGHSRLGLEVSRTLAATGASVTVAARDLHRARAATADIPGVRVEQLDLANSASITAFAARWKPSALPSTRW